MCFLRNKKCTLITRDQKIPIPCIFLYPSFSSFLVNTPVFTCFSYCRSGKPAFTGASYTTISCPANLVYLPEYPPIGIPINRDYFPWFRSSFFHFHRLSATFCERWTRAWQDLSAVSWSGETGPVTGVFWAGQEYLEICRGYSRTLFHETGNLLKRWRGWRFSFRFNNARRSTWKRIGCGMGSLRIFYMESRSGFSTCLSWYGMLERC